MCTVGGWIWSEAGVEMFLRYDYEDKFLFWDCTTALAPDIKNFFK